VKYQDRCELKIKVKNYRYEIKDGSIKIIEKLKVETANP